MVETINHTYELRITLEGSQPPIWRTFRVPADIALDELHYVIQLVMGWTNSHLHEFRKGRQRFGDLEADPMASNIEPEDQYALCELLTRCRQKLIYLYDYGDCWSHVIELTAKLDGPCDCPFVTDGEMACPPEDCGGISGYEYMLEAIADPNHDRHEYFLEWLSLDGPDDFDPTVYPIDTTNEDLSIGIDAIVDWFYDMAGGAPEDWEDEEYEPVLERSPLCRLVTHNGQAYEIDIYRDPEQPDEWLLEVYDEENGSYAWNETFVTDQAALNEALAQIKVSVQPSLVDRLNFPV